MSANLSTETQIGGSLHPGVGREQFRARNGDTLADLQWRQLKAIGRFESATNELCAAEEKLRPLRIELEGAWSEKENIECRLAIWENEWQQAKKAPND